MSSSTPEELAPSLSAPHIIVFPIVSLSVMYFVYGFYTLLFGTCIYMMRSRQKENEQLNWNLYLVLTVALFIFSTAFVIVYTTYMVYGAIVAFTAVKTQDYEPFMDYLTHNAENIITDFLQMLLSILLNITAECMLIHRCYLIWGSKKRIAIPLIVASALTNVVGLVGAIMITIGESDKTIDSNLALYKVGSTIVATYQTASPTVNFILSFLTAGRIWWIHRQVRAHNIYTTKDKLIYAVSRIILESGLLYPIFSIITLVSANTPRTGIILFDFLPLMILSSGIAPTLIMVRAKLGKNVESLQDQISGIRFTSRPAPREETTTIPQTPVYSIENLGMAEVELEEGNEQQMMHGKRSTVMY
ncbi:hypothetical protein WG66_005660 [Moniliophthora roreri]|nr:hypothetical protein WG66_005660 [Moniliophthora roreri]